jgi:Transglycosylase SLT domain
MDGPTDDDRPENLPKGEVGDAIYNAAKRHNMDPRTLGGIASIESSFQPESNYNKPTQYKGLFQIGRDEWNQYGGGGNIYDPSDNADAAARMLSDHAGWFKGSYGRDPSPAELYMMHQQGRGFFSNGAQTNFVGNTPSGYPVARSSQQHMDQWGQVLARRMNEDPPALSYAGYDPVDPATGAINRALRRQGSSMPNNGALSTSNVVGPGALNQQLGGLGPALQDAGAYLMATSPFVKAPDTDHAAKFMAQNSPQVIELGTDPFTGGKKFGIVRNGQIVPMGVGSGSGGGSKTPDMDQVFDNVNTAINNGAQPGSPEIRKLIPPSMRPYLDALEQGKALPSHLSRGGAGRNAIMMLAQADTPGGFDETIAEQRAKAALDIDNKSPGGLGNKIDANSKFTDHLLGAQEILDAQEKLLPKGGTSMPLNMAYNELKKFGSDKQYQQLAGLWNARVEALAGEYGKVQTGNMSAEASKKEVREALDPNLPLERRRAALADLTETTQAAVRSGLVPYNAAFRSNKAPEDFLTPKQQAGIKKQQEYREKILAGAGSGGAPAANRPPLGDIFK